MGDMVLFDLDAAPRLLDRFRMADDDVAAAAARCQALYLRVCKTDGASPRLREVSDWLADAADDLDWRIDLVRSSQAIPLFGDLLVTEVDGMVGMEFTYPSQEAADAAAEGRDLVRRVDDLLEEGDVEQAMEALSELQEREADLWFVRGFADALGPDGVEGLQQRFEDAEPEDRGGFWGVVDDVTGAVSDFAGGAWDATWGTVTTVHGLTTQVLFDPGEWAGNWGDLGSGLWWGAQNPGDFALALVDWEGLKDNPARWLGSLAPDAVAAFFTAGTVTTARRGIGAADTAADLSRTADRADDAADAAQAVDDLEVLRGLDGEPLPPAAPGDPVFRVFGGRTGVDELLGAPGPDADSWMRGSGPWGGSWSPVDPRLIDDYRAAAGLPDINTGRFLIEARLRDIPEGFRTRQALPLDGQPGGLPEYLIPDAERHLDPVEVQGLNRMDVSAPPAPFVRRSLETPESLRGASEAEVRALIPDGWEPRPLKKGEGTRYLNPDRPSEAIMIERGWPGAADPLHSGPYVRISRNGEIVRIPLEGNPVLEP